MRRMIRPGAVVGVFVIVVIVVMAFPRPGFGDTAKPTLIEPTLIEPTLIEPSPVELPLDNPALEARARALFKELRCLVCQNQSISDSNADLARDLRTIVRERITAGDTNAQARAFIVARYGDWVLLNPPFKRSTVLLWLGPLVLAGAAVVLAVGFYRRRKSANDQTATPLDAQERERLRSILGGSDDA